MQVLLRSLDDVDIVAAGQRKDYSIDFTGMDVKFMEDARSAAFFSMGQAVKSGQTAVLIVPGKYLENTYTALVEAYFQKISILLIAEYANVQEMKTGWLDRYLKDEFLLEGITEDSIEEIKEKIRHPGIRLLKWVNNEPCAGEGVDYSKILSILSGLDIVMTKVLCYDCKDGCQNEYGVMPIDNKYKYGVVSKYVGQAAAGGERILCCTPECILVDLNIIRTRYAGKNIKIIILDSKDELKKKRVTDWIANNGWECKIYTEINRTEMEKFLDIDRASVLIVR